MTKDTDIIKAMYENRTMDAVNSLQNSIYRHVDRLQSSIDALEDKVHDLSIDVATNKTKIMMWGVFGGLIVSGLEILTSFI